MSQKNRESIFWFVYLFYFCRGVQWNSPKNVAKPGGTGWTPQPMAATTGAGYRPMVRFLMLSLYHCNTLLLVLVC
jgi:hypothetical protein